MRAKSGPRSMTFTGCWTCKRRKVKCDERPQECMNCERLNIQCDGYGVKLQWVTDPFSDSRTNQNQRKGRIRIRRDHGTVYSMQAIEGFLSALENDAGRCIPSQKGPFNLFPSHKQESEPFTKEYEERQAVYSPAKRIGLYDGQTAETATSEVDVYLEDTNCLLVDNSDSSNNDCLLSSDIFSSPSLTSSSSVQPTAKFIDGGNNAFGIVSAIGLEKYSTEDQKDVLPETTPTVAHDVVPRSVFTAISVDESVNKLMHHYVLHVTGLLQPIDHPHNPYRTLYVPAALTVASGPPPTGTLAMTDPNVTIHAVLLHSLMSSSAFHIWNCSPAQPQYHRLGAQHRREALSLLTTALKLHTSSMDYKTLMMAMLSLVSIDIMSGCEADFVVHLRGTKQLQRRRQNWRIMSTVTRQLNQISDFLFLLTRTTWLPTSAAALSLYRVDGEDDATALQQARMQTDSCYPYMYGISPTLASYMLETCQLAERLSVHEHSGSAPPESLLEACESLGDRILLWSFEQDDVRISTADQDRLAMDILRPHAQAWHRAIVLYYFRRIHRTHSPDQEQHVRTIAACMHAVEDVKAQAPRALAHQMAPITWPAFMASCEGVQRAPWTSWWQRVQQDYQIANIRRQWEMVQRIWQHQDVMAQAGRQDEFDWMEAFRGYGVTMIPI